MTVFTLLWRLLGSRRQPLVRGNNGQTHEILLKGNDRYKFSSIHDCVCSEPSSAAAAAQSITLIKVTMIRPTDKTSTLSIFYKGL